MDGIKNPELLTLADLATWPELYGSLSDQLAEMECPDELTVRYESEGLRLGRTIPVPADIDTFSASLCYGQKYFMTTEERNDINVIVRYVGGYFFPLVTRQKWDEAACIKWAQASMPTMRPVDLYPIATRLLNLMKEVAERERTLLKREPTPQEKKAHIERLDKFGDLSALKFLQREFGCTREEVMQLPYNDCLVEFVYHHEVSMFQDRLTEVYRQEQESKTKNKYK